MGWAPPDLPLRPAPPAGPGLSRLGQWGGNPGEECGPCLSGDSRLQRAARAAGGLGRWPGPDRAGSAHAPHRWASPPRPQAQHRLSPPAAPAPSASTAATLRAAALHGRRRVLPEDALAAGAGWPQPSLSSSRSTQGGARCTVLAAEGARVITGPAALRPVN